MATKKKVASKTTKKAVPAKKAVAKKASAPKKAASKPAPAKKAAAPKKAAVKKAAPKAAKPAPKKAAVKKAAAKATPSKAVPAKKKAEVAKKPVKAKAVKSAPAKTPAAKAPAAKKPAVVVKAPVKKAAAKAAPAPKAKPAPAAARKTPVKKQAPEPFISKPVEKVDIMASKSKQDKSDKEPVKKTRVEEPARRTTEKPSSRTPSKPASGRTVVKTVTTYSPEFTKSVLDQPEAPSGPIYRYSDPELQEFKEIILKKLEAAKKELVYLQGLITRKDEAGTDDTENKYMSMEDGSGSQEREQLNQMASRQIQFIDHLEKALVRIENKTYGICRVTGKLIEKARLKAVPHATLSIEAKLAKSK